ncbi:MAG TPA: alpha/beta family hydrolase [Alphaproteobacteria bacterium]|jgi:predicted alpha/beta-hydrolase family hydrolase|nr:alpha/beta family hydrolase [Alphaproteobacteria bacterium]
MNTKSNFKYFHSSKSKTLDVVLHGSSAGMDSSLINKIVDVSRKNGNSVVAFNFLFLERGDEHSSGPELVEEIETLKSVLEFCKGESYPTVRLIGKSLGAIIAAKFLTNLNSEEQTKYEIIVFGYVTGSIDLKNFVGKTVIIQGEKDKFGNIEIVKQDMKNAISKDVSYFEIKNADHSYRDPETKEPIYEDQAVLQLFS